MSRVPSPEKSEFTLAFTGTALKSPRGLVELSVQSRPSGDVQNEARPGTSPSTLCASSPPLPAWIALKYVCGRVGTLARLQLDPSADVHASGDPDEVAPTATKPVPKSVTLVPALSAGFPGRDT